MSNNIEQLVKLERALEVQLYAKKFYSGLSELDENQKEHLKKIDENIDQLVECRDELCGKSRESVVLSPAVQELLGEYEHVTGSNPENPPAKYELRSVDTAKKEPAITMPALDSLPPLKLETKRNLFWVGLFLLFVAVVSITLSVGVKKSPAPDAASGLPSTSSSSSTDPALPGPTGDSSSNNSAATDSAAPLSSAWTSTPPSNPSSLQSPNSATTPSDSSTPPSPDSASAPATADSTMPSPDSGAAPAPVSPMAASPTPSAPAKAKASRKTARARRVAARRADAAADAAAAAVP